MSTDLTQFQGASVPAAFQPLMQQMQSSELSENVGTKYGVISIKGKVFRIKYDGVETPLTIVHNGATFAAPYFDVILPMANGQLSKTWYTSGYTEGSDESPTCWSEDGLNPLAPLDKRPKVNGAPCTDCRVCPMNMFGSKVNSETGSKGKACADTRKLAVLPVDGQGQIDFENEKFGGVMLMRIPAASLSPLAEMDRRLQGMGIPYFAVVLRMSFDQTVAYPKLAFTPVRMVTEQEAQRILALRNDPAVLHLLGADQTAAPPSQQLPAPEQHVPAAVQQVQTPPPPSNVTPITAAAPASATPVPQAPPQAPAAPAPQMPAPAPTATPTAPAPAPAAFTPPPAPVAPATPQPAPAAFEFPQAPTAAFQPPQVPQQPVQAAPAPAPDANAPQAPTVDPGLLSRVDQLLGT